jgi:hypothetical protein
MAIRVIVSDTALGDHANTVKAAISLGYGSDISDQIEIKTGGLSADLAYADSIGAIAVVRSTTGYSSYASLAESYYPRILMFMPLGSNSNIELTTALSVIVSSGAGDAENKNNTAYGDGLEFWDNDYDTATSDDVSSYSNGVVAGKLLKIRDTLNTDWVTAREYAQETADRLEPNRTMGTKWHKYNGYGKINISNAINYNTEMTNKTLNIELTEPNECDISFIKGDTFALTVNVKNNGVAFNMSGYVPILTAKLDEDGVTPDLQLTGADIDITNASIGELTFTFSPADTESLTAGNYFYDVQITSTLKNYTVIKANLELVEDITKETTTTHYLITEDSNYLIFE